MEHGNVSNVEHGNVSNVEHGHVSNAEHGNDICLQQQDICGEMLFTCAFMKTLRRGYNVNS